MSIRHTRVLSGLPVKKARRCCQLKLHTWKNFSKVNTKQFRVKCLGSFKNDSLYVCEGQAGHYLLYAVVLKDQKALSRKLDS